MWKFIKSSSEKGNWLNHQQTEICFIGRSNVGKSTLINLIGNQKIAKVSKTPGRTQLINYFQTDKNIIAVDLPGYGYAKISKNIQEKMFAMIDEYFKLNRPKKVFILIDAKIGIQPKDSEIISYLSSLDHNISLILTKCDKANQSEINKTLKNELFKSFNYFMVSEKNQKQIGSLREYIYSLE